MCGLVIFATDNHIFFSVNLLGAIVIEMSAHTDSRGSDEYNFRLSDDRARSCMNYILLNGIDPSRITSKGYGETVPVATNNTDEGRQLNRRVEFKIISVLPGPPSL
jgi:outer membrane protein OmpA-like peptidoglycan-associated protein